MNPWDTSVFGHNVADLLDLQFSTPGETKECLDALEDWLNMHTVKLAACRLRFDRYRESIALQERSFRYVEMLLHPYCKLEVPNSQETNLFRIGEATSQDISLITEWAGRCFQFERYHADPRISNEFASDRYRRWISDISLRKTAKILKVEDSTIDAMLAFFVVDDTTEQVNWILTALDPERTGKGLGKRVWAAMLDYHATNGHSSVVTSISSNNQRILNLYASMNFRFQPPEVTYHYLRGSF